MAINKSKMKFNKPRRTPGWAEVVRGQSV